MQKIRLIIPIGLVGSGKTYYGANTLKNKYKKEYHHIGFDGVDDMSDLSKVLYYRYNHNDTTYYFDYEWTTEADIINLVKTVVKSEKKHNNERYYGFCEIRVISNIDLIYFKENREQCDINTNNEHTSEIMSSDFMGKPTDEFMEQLKDLLDTKHTNCNITLHEVDVHVTNKFDRVLGKHNIYDSTIKSESWRTGGEWGNCWGDSGTIGAEGEKQFVLLDDILQDLCPNITFLQYKRLFNNICHQDESTDYGYYGSYTEHRWWYCNTEDLKNELINLGVDIN